MRIYIYIASVIGVFLMSVACYAAEGEPNYVGTLIQTYSDGTFTAVDVYDDAEIVQGWYRVEENGILGFLPADPECSLAEIMATEEEEYWCVVDEGVCQATLRCGSPAETCTFDFYALNGPDAVHCVYTVACLKGSLNNPNG